MAKLIIVVALCIASTLAVPSGTPDSQLGDCFDALKVDARAALIKSIDDLTVCAADAISEIEDFRADLEVVIVAAFNTLKAKVEEHKACNTVVCKVKVIREIADLVSMYIREVEGIANKHFEILVQEFPDTADCAEHILEGLKASAKNIILNFVNCIL